MNFASDSGKVYRLLASPISSDEEGTTHYIEGDRTKIAKIFSNVAPIEEKEKKFEMMMQTSLEDRLRARISWPVDLLYEGGNFKGFIAENRKTPDSFDSIYRSGPGSSREGISWKKRVEIAKDFCILVKEVHDAGQICGNLSPENVHADTYKGFTFLTDADSFQITDVHQNVHRCNKGSSNYLPKEIQKQIESEDLSTAPLPTFTKESDHFALTVHIFQLLMNGIHPFEGNMLLQECSVRKPKPNERIIRGYIPFFKLFHKSEIPAFAPPINILPKSIISMLKKGLTFNRGHPASRPAAPDWFFALDELSKNIVVCENNPKHEYHEDYGKCPWCEMEGVKGSGSLKKKELKENTTVKNVGAGNIITNPSIATPSTHIRQTSVQQQPRADYSNLMSAWIHVMNSGWVYYVGKGGTFSYEKGSLVRIGFSNHDGHVFIPLGLDKIKIFPDRIETGIFFRNTALNVSMSNGIFMEENKREIPGADMVSYRWFHQRVDGGPDRRYKVNYKIYNYRFGWFEMNMDGVGYRFMTLDTKLSSMFRTF